MASDSKEPAEPTQDLAPEDKFTPVVLDIPTEVVNEASTKQEAPEEAFTEPTLDPEPEPAPESEPEPDAPAPANPEYPEHPFVQVPFPDAEELLLLMPFNKRSKKWLVRPVLITLAVLAGIALVIYLIFFAVMKPDYQNASNDVSTVRDKYSIATDLPLSATIDKIQTAKDAYGDFKTENEKLAGLKAFKYDKDLKAKYDAYAAKAKTDIAYEDSFFPSFALFANANAQIDTLGTDAKSFTADTVQSTIDIYKSIDDITNPELRAFVNSSIDIYKDILPQAQIYESAAATAAQKQAALTAIKASSDKLTAISATFTHDLTAKLKAVGLQDDLTGLLKAVDAKL